MSGWGTAGEGMSPEAHLKPEVWNAWITLGMTRCGYHIYSFSIAMTLIG